MVQSKNDIMISQKKYAMYILDETGLMNTKPINTPIDPNTKLLPSQREPLSNPKRYKRQVGKLNYFTVTYPYLFCSVL